MPLRVFELVELAEEVERKRDALDDAMTRAYCAGLRIDASVQRQRNRTRRDRYPAITVDVSMPIEPKGDPS